MATSLPEISKDAPFTAEQREWLQSYMTEFAKRVTGATAAPAASGPVKPRALFLVGSQSGNAQALAEGFVEVMNGDGWATTCRHRTS